jgi:hypothetical protein
MTQPSIKYIVTQKLDLGLLEKRKTNHPYPHNPAILEVKRPAAFRPPATRSLAFQARIRWQLSIELVNEGK